MERLASLTAARHDTDKHFGQTVQKAVRISLIHKYHLSMSEQLLMSCDAKQITEGTSSEVRGKLHLFSSWIVWAPRKGEHTAVMTRNVVSFDEAGRELLITIASEKISETTSYDRSMTPQPLGGQDSTFVSYTKKAAGQVYEMFRSRFRGPPGDEGGNFSPMPPALSRHRGSVSAHGQGMMMMRGIVAPMLRLESGSSAHHFLAKDSIRLKFPNLALLRGFRIQATERKARLDKAAGIHWQMRREAKVHGRQTHGAAWIEFGYVLNGDDEQDGGEKEHTVLKEIFDLAVKYHYQEGETIIPAFTPGQALLHVVKGTAHVINKRGAILQEFGEGEILGVPSFLDQSNIGDIHDIRASTPVEILSISRVAIEDLCLKKPLAGARIFRNLCIHASVKLQVDLLSMRAWRS